MTTSPVRPVVLRNGVDIDDPLTVVLGFLKAPGRFDVSDPARSESFGEPDLRLANQGGARISAAQIAAILQRRGPIGRALRDGPPGAWLTAQVNSVPWLPLRQPSGAVAGTRRAGLAKMTTALYPQAPGADPPARPHGPGVPARRRPRRPGPAGRARAGLARGYRRDLDRNQAAVQAVRQDLTRRGYALTEVRILDLPILSAQAAARPAHP